MVQEHIKIFQERQNLQEHIKISRRAFSKLCKNTYDFPGAKNIIKKDQIFQEMLSKILLEQIRFSRRKKYHKNRSNFPGELSQNFVRPDTIFQETIPQEQIFWKITSLGAFVLFIFRLQNTYIKVKMKEADYQFSITCIYQHVSKNHKKKRYILENVFQAES